MVLSPCALKCFSERRKRKLTLKKYFHFLPQMPNGETVTLLSCTRRASDSIDRRFCVDLTVQEKYGIFKCFRLTAL